MWLPLLAIALVCSAQDAGYYQYQNAGSSHQAGLYGYGHHRIQVSGSQDGYASSPPQDRYGASSFEDRYSVSSSSEDRYGVSSSEDTYGVSSSSEARYGVSSSEDRYGVSSSEDRKGVSSSKDRYGMSSSEDRYGVSSSEDRYGVSSSEDSYASSTSATEEKAFLVAGSRSCSGTEVEWQECRDMPTCNHCVPQNCEFAQWGKWYDAGGCTGLCFRHRALAQPNNECGRPCSGVQEDTKPCFKRECGRKPEEDAMFGSWSEWGLCDSGQRDRHREVATQAAHGGRSVEGPLREVQPCGQGHVVDCEMNQWNAWTTCSCTCGQGWHTRDRRIIRFSANGGKPCVGSTREEHPCNEQPCNGLACQFSPWSSWAGCDGYRPFQRDRHRRVEQPGSNGAGCSGTTHEMEGCTSHGPSDCVISQWDQWSSCDKHCDGGQQVRHRKLIHPAHSGGTCPQSKMKQIRGCNTQSCHSNQNDCILSPWRSWSACTAQCEDGVRKREREVLQRAGEGGRGCSGVMMQVVSCTGPGCGEQDCQWGPWDSWSGCSCSCGGGTKRRNRQVQVSPKGGGELCDPVDKSEAAPCNQHRCFEHCTDARWSEWKQWSECSASCGYGFKFRHRSHQVQANSCGRPATGRGQEWDVCEGSGVGSAVCGDRDGRLSAWNEWSDCSCTCFGIRERQRIVEQYHFGNGKPIPFAPLKQIQPCHPGPRELAPSECVHHHADCKLSQWNEWTECPVTCGGGNKMRLRYIFTPASNNGRPCEAALRETTPCATNPCGEGCVDCLWGHWSEWGACSKCGDQRFRQRDIMKLANHCGKRCEARDAKEVSNCTSQCDSMSFCVWKPWTSWSGCSADCGPATRLRERSLGLVQNKPYEYLFKVAHDSYAGLCAGTQTDTEACPTRPCDNRCVPTDCTFSPWGEWHQPSCIGLCTRSRSISVVNNECGEPCHGPLVATKRCLEECTEVLDCEFRSWSHWSQMDRSGPGALRYRSREVSQMPRNGGKPCEGDIREVDSFCEENDHLQHCRLIPWSDWVSCSKTCGGGWQLRTRAVAQPARNGGQPCQGDLSEGQTCAEFPCQEGDCVLAPWSSWGDCWGGQRTRSRRVEREATAGGRPCGGPGSPVLLGETRPCSQHGMDCQVSAWSAWDSCDKSCGGGEQQRHRQVQVYPMHGGLPCPTSLRELRACGSYSCGTVDCEATAWTEWGACSVQCGAGQQQRDRQIARSAQGEGRKCNFILSETRACRHTGGGSMPGCGMVNCLWGDWSSWSGCTCSCGGGQRTRNRHIAQSPQGGGGRCEAKHKEEIGPCNTHSCAETACRDGAWGEWQEWSPCSASCTGGLRYRHRRMEHEANECGRPAEGFSRDVAPCNQNVPCAGDVNCQFDSWTQWSACTRTCDGIKRRSRRIAVHGRGRGEWCVGATKETSPCAPSPGAPAPIACQPVHARDCIISQWSSWGQCDVTCGGGQSMRERSVDHEARGGGTPCMGSLTETRGCHNQECHHEGPRRDCRWGEWSQWGACNKCGGQRERFRHVLHEALNGGRPCELGAAEETGRCPRKCHEAMYCIWSQWESWSDCSMSCGTGGIRHRQRALALKTEAEVHALGLLYEVNESLASPRLPSQGAQFQMIAAFAGGIMATMVLLHLPQSLRAWFAERDHIPTSQIELAEPQGFLSRWWAHREAQNDGYLPVSTAVGSDLDA